MTDPHAPHCEIRTGGHCDCTWDAPPFDIPYRSEVERSHRFRRLEGRFETAVIIACVFILGAVSALIATALMG